MRNYRTDIENFLSTEILGPDEFGVGYGIDFLPFEEKETIRALEIIYNQGK